MPTCGHFKVWLRICGCWQPLNLILLILIAIKSTRLSQVLLFGDLNHTLLNPCHVTIVYSTGFSVFAPQIYSLENHSYSHNNHNLAKLTTRDYWLQTQISPNPIVINVVVVVDVVLCKYYKQPCRSTKSHHATSQDLLWRYFQHLGSHGTILLSFEQMVTTCCIYVGQV